ncbi:MAG: helix-turn-helix transcriptional regulator [Lachnospiraceae bacterium]|nr:helix-turn-helix transcriptional regulator [Lachnospiraceae bacterium]
MTLNYKVIGNRIQIRRKQRGYTQEQMAEALDFSVGFISQVERGITKLSLDSLANIAEFLECNISSIVDDTNREDYTYFQTDFNSLYESLSYEDQRLFYYMLEVYAKDKQTKDKKQNG